MVGLTLEREKEFIKIYNYSPHENSAWTRLQIYYFKQI